MNSDNRKHTTDSVFRSIRAFLARDAHREREGVSRDADRPATTGNGRDEAMTLTTRQLEFLLREAGCSKSLSKTIAGDVSRRYRTLEFEK